MGCYHGPSIDEDPEALATNPQLGAAEPELDPGSLCLEHTQ